MQIRRAFRHANQIYNPHRVWILEYNRVDLPVERSHRIIAQPNLACEFVLRPDEQQQCVDDAAERLDAGIRPQGETLGHAGVELRTLVGENRGSSDQAHSYWVPWFDRQAETGLTVNDCFWENIGGREAVFVRRRASVNTFAHELGHLLTEEGHVNDDRTNLMYPDDTRTDTRLNDHQLSLIRRSPYVHPMPEDWDDPQRDFSHAVAAGGP